MVHFRSSGTAHEEAGTRKRACRQVTTTHLRREDRVDLSSYRYLPSMKLVRFLCFHDSILEDSACRLSVTGIFSKHTLQVARSE